MHLTAYSAIPALLTPCLCGAPTGAAVADHPIAGVSTSVTAFVGTAPRGPVGRAVLVRSFAEYERAFGSPGDGSALGDTMRLYFLNGGRDAWVVRRDPVPALAAREAPRRSGQSGLRALDAVDVLNLLCLPGVTDRGLLAEAAAYCEQRGAFLVLDAPGGAQAPDDLLQALSASPLPASRNGAVYYPWLRVDDPAHPGQTRAAPPCGAVAGLYARVDASRGVWKAPAGSGAQLLGVKAPARALNDAEIDRLNARCVNSIRAFAGSPAVVWAARTLAGASGGGDWRYVPVRRTALYVTESVSRGTRWAAFEPNGPALWAALRASVSAFLMDLWRQGAFQGATPAEAFFVKCDQTTTTQDEVSRGVVNILLGFAPLRPAEFIIVHIQQKAGPAPP